MNDDNDDAVATHLRDKYGERIASYTCSNCIHWEWWAQYGASARCLRFPPHPGGFVPSDDGLAWHSARDPKTNVFDRCGEHPMIKKALRVYADD